MRLFAEAKLHFKPVPKISTALTLNRTPEGIPQRDICSFRPRVGSGGSERLRAPADEKGRLRLLRMNVIKIAMIVVTVIIIILLAISQ